MSNTIYWDPSADADIASYLIESAPAPTGPWTTVAAVVDARPGPNYVAGPPAQFFVAHAAGTLSTWYRLSATDAASQTSDPSAVFQVGTSSTVIATSEVDVAQMALACLGSTATVTSIAAPVSKEERFVALFYPRLRDRLFKLLKPQWAVRRAPLALDTTALRPGWAYVYRLPPDLLQAVDIEGSGYRGGVPLSIAYPAPYGRDPSNPLNITPAAPFAIEANNIGTGRVLCTDIPDASLVYVARITDPSVWSPEFLEAVVWSLAARLVMPLAVKPDMAANALQWAKQFAADAAVSDLNEQHRSPMPDSEFITGRNW